MKGNVAVIAAIAVVVVLSVGVIGWMFVNKGAAPAPEPVAVQPVVPTEQQPDQQPAPMQATQESLKTGFKPSDKPGFSTYTNIEAGFSIDLPNRVALDAPQGVKGCDPYVKATSIVDNTNGVVYIRPAQAISSDKKSCVPMTAALAAKEDDPTWVIHWVSVRTDADIDQFLKKVYGKTCSAGTKIDTTVGDNGSISGIATNIQAGVDNVLINGCSLGVPLMTRYSPKMQKIFAVTPGQFLSFSSEIYDTSIMTTPPDTFDKPMVESFRILEVDKTAGWQTYSNTDYGFELKMPQTWKATLGDWKGAVDGMREVTLSAQDSKGVFHDVENIIVTPTKNVAKCAAITLCNVGEKIAEKNGYTFGDTFAALGDVPGAVDFAMNDLDAVLASFK